MQCHLQNNEVEWIVPKWSRQVLHKEGLCLCSINTAQKLWPQANDREHTDGILQRTTRNAHPAQRQWVLNYTGQDQVKTNKCSPRIFAITTK